MKRIAFALLLLSISITSKAAELAVSEGWARASIPGAVNGAAYLTLNNRSEQAVSLIGLSSSITQQAELHTHRHDEGMMKMEHVPELTLAAGETVTMQPGGYHVMLMGLKKPLKSGATIHIVLHFSDNSSQTVELTVRDSK